MAKTDPTKSPRSVTLSLADVHSLADRLAARATSMLSLDKEHLEGPYDLLTAARALRAMSRSFSPTDTLTLEANGA